MKRFLFLSLILIPCLLTVSCKEKEDDNTTGDPAQLGVVVKDALAVYEVPEHQNVSLSLMVTAEPTSAEAYTITLGADPGLVSSYNSKNGTDYKMLPTSAYAFSTNSVVLPRYSAKSSACELRLKGEDCDPDLVYLLPVTIDAVQGGTNFQAPEDKAAYIVFKMIASESEGDGTQAHPFIVKDIESFLAINSMLQDEATTYFKMTADLDFKDVAFTYSAVDDPFTPGDGETINPWIPINYATEDDAVTAAEKRRIVFDGNNHKISNFKAGGSIFGILVGSVENLTIENADIDCISGNLGGVLVGIGGAGSEENGITDDANIKNVSIKNSKVFNDWKRTGGLMSWLKSGVIENVDVDCVVEGGDQQVGGMFGRISKGTLTNCSQSGDVTGLTAYSGGIVGIAKDVTFTGCHASGNVTHTTSSYTRAGGLIGQIDGSATIEKCYATGNVKGINHMAGGLIGVIGHDGAIITINECYATGNVTLKTDSGNVAHAGGLLGTISAENAKVTITNCYCTGAIANRRYSGGFVGSIYSKVASLDVSNSFTTSDISGIVVKDKISDDPLVYRHRCGLFIGLVDRWDAGTVVKCKGFVAWRSGAWYDDETDPTRKTGEFEFSYVNYDHPDWEVPVDGNYCGNEGTVSQQAKALNWDETVWDLSGNLPKLKNVK